jgi:peptidoglycan/xylan/chitin deacetylase (PgdA/CDA1 family)
MERAESEKMKMKKRKYFYDPPLPVKKVFSEYLWSSSCDKIILTFDDGPNSATTEKILRTLEEQNAQALFFCVGENLQRHETLAREIINSGHALGNHTWKHSILTNLKKNERADAIASVSEFALEKLDYEMKFFRPPHGKFYLGLNNTLKTLGLRNVMWSLLTYDYENNFDIVKFAIDNFLRRNSVVVFHDSDKSRDVIIKSLNYLFAKAKEKGFEFGKISECLK